MTSLEKCQASDSDAIERGVFSVRDFLAAQVLFMHDDIKSLMYSSNANFCLHTSAADGGEH